MLNYSLADIASLIGAAPPGRVQPVEHLLLDSRRIAFPATSLFFAIRGERRDGHRFIREAYQKGVRGFVISEQLDEAAYPGASFLRVNDTLAALQQLAAAHRSRFHIPVIGITGSNGKTIVKEWLFQLLHPDYQVVRSPRSYNSQVGVPLSVWQMGPRHTLGLFEAGISKPGEMQRLLPVIRPDIVVLTNIGEAHSEGFAGREQKATEKLWLARGAKQLIYGEGQTGVAEAIAKLDTKPELLRWGRGADCFLQIQSIVHLAAGTRIEAVAGSREQRHHASIEIPFTDEASIQNAISCWTVLLALNIRPELIRERMQRLQPVNMRLELKKGINHCILINDSYSADLSSLDIALNFLGQQQGATRKTVILSDFLQTAMPPEELQERIVDQLLKHQVQRLIGIGGGWQHARDREWPQGLQVEIYESTDAFLQQFRSSLFREEAILIKGARVFAFEKIVEQLEQQVHQTVLEINLSAIVHNLNVYQRYLKPETRIMAMVKAFAYGSGGAEIAGILQYHQVDYLGVAYADEGVELRKAGIRLPIMVMNPGEAAFESIVEHNLEPDLYSMDLLHSFAGFLERSGLQQYPVHLEIETGMNRLGFAGDDMEALTRVLGSQTAFRVQSVFSHLVASEDPSEDAFTLQQYDRFCRAADQLGAVLSYPFLRHIANSGAIFRLPGLQLDMVRLGIGMYGVDSSGSHQGELQPVACLKSAIAQIKKLKAGESVGYNRRGRLLRDSVIATVRIGYADGYSRRLGNGAGRMLVHGLPAPVIGTVCMDMTMVDVTDIPGVKEGDEVIVFGSGLPIRQLAEWAGTIPYEIMTGISQRVKRVYFEE